MHAYTINRVLMWAAPGPWPGPEALVGPRLQGPGLAHKSALLAIYVYSKQIYSSPGYFVPKYKNNPE